MPSLVRAAALTGYAELTRDLGLDPLRLLDAVGLPRAALADPERLVPAGLVGRLLELTAAASGREDFGVRLGAMREPGNLGLIALVAREAPSMRQGVESLIRYVPLHNQALELRLQVLNEDCLLEPRFDNRRGRPMRQSLELTLTVLHRMLASLFGAEWQPDLVCLPHAAPRDPAMHRRVFGAPLQFGATATGLVCSRARLEQPRATVATLQGRDARAYLEGLRAGASRSLAERAATEIAQLLGTGGCTADALAARLGRSRRTLHRQLAAEDTSYAALLDQARQALIRQQLAQGTQRLDELAAMLGFAAAPVLARWFRTRFGCSIGAWRREMASSGIRPRRPSGPD